MSGYQLDLVGLPLDDATTRRIALPQPREVLRRRLRDVLGEASADEMEQTEANHGA